MHTQQFGGGAYMPILIVLFIIILYIPLGIIFNVTKPYYGGKTKSRRRRRKF